MPSNFPEFFDDNSNLYLVHDALRLKLADDYNPGDTFISIEPDPLFDIFPPSGVITLTEQCSDIQNRAISFEYSSKGTNTFEGLVLSDDFADVVKPKRITNVTLNVIDKHHNQLKDAIIAIEGYVGVKGETGSLPLEGTLEERINYLRKLVLKPKAWFTTDKHIGILPLTINFKDFSTRQPLLWVWDFGDGDIQEIERSDTVLNGNITKIYNTPGRYDVTLTVTNDYGVNSITIPNIVTARIEAPDESSIDFIPTAAQIYSGGVIRSRINQLITTVIDSNGEQPLDSIINYVWEFGDDLEHGSRETETASYSIGGIYDVKLKTETELGGYRVTTFEDSVDIVEKFNIWHFIFDSSQSLTDTTKTSYVYEFGLLSETYKAAHVSSSLTVTRDAGFLAGVDNEDQQYREFRRNNGFSPKTLTSSGDQGDALVFWAEGAPDTSSDQYIRFREFNGFDNSWTTPNVGGDDKINRYWNWLCLNSGSNLYFLFGAPGPDPFIGSPTNQEFKTVDLSSYSVDDLTFTVSNYQNNASELMTNVGSGTGGDFSVYRGTWKDSSGYILRNDGTGPFFRIKSFYRTEGTISLPLQLIRKLTDMPGSTKFEGQMVNLSQGIYFFNNTGEVVVYNPSTNTWGVGGPGVNSPDFTKLQDTDVTDYDSAYNTLIAVSDESTNAYLFFDYSPRAQIKFNETDLTFTTLPVRPSGEQFMAGLY
jgi:hypothetical protein